MDEQEGLVDRLGTTTGANGVVVCIRGFLEIELRNARCGSLHHRADAPERRGEGVRYARSATARDGVAFGDFEGQSLLVSKGDPSTYLVCKSLACALAK